MPILTKKGAEALLTFCNSRLHILIKNDLEISNDDFQSILRLFSILQMKDDFQRIILKVEKNSDTSLHENKFKITITNNSEKSSADALELLKAAINTDQTPQVASAPAATVTSPQSQDAFDPRAKERESATITQIAATSAPDEAVAVTQPEVEDDFGQFAVSRTHSTKSTATAALPSAQQQS